MPKFSYTANGIEHTVSIGGKLNLTVYYKDGSSKVYSAHNFIPSSIPNGSFAYVEEGLTTWYIVDRNTGVWLYKSNIAGKPSERVKELIKNTSFMEIFDSPAKLEVYQIEMMRNPIREV